VHQGVFAIPTGDVGAVRLWAFNVGFYNILIAGGLVVGVIGWMNGNEAIGRALVIYLCIFGFLAGIALFASDRLALSWPRGKGVGGALAQGVPTHRAHRHAAVIDSAVTALTRHLSGPLRP
jgi:putative membrane protein